jgi:hypothetical protein
MLVTGGDSTVAAALPDGDDGATTTHGAAAVQHGVHGRSGVPAVRRRLSAPLHARDDAVALSHGVLTRSPRAMILMDASPAFSGRAHHIDPLRNYF